MLQRSNFLPIIIHQLLQFSRFVYVNSLRTITPKEKKSEAVKSLERGGLLVSVPREYSTKKLYCCSCSMGICLILLWPIPEDKKNQNLSQCSLSLSRYLHCTTFTKVGLINLSWGDSAPDWAFKGVRLWLMYSYCISRILDSAILPFDKNILGKICFIG